MWHHEVASWDVWNRDGGERERSSVPPRVGPGAWGLLGEEEVKAMVETAVAPLVIPIARPHASRLATGGRCWEGQGERHVGNLLRGGAGADAVTRRALDVRQGGWGGEAGLGRGIVGPCRYGQGAAAAEEGEGGGDWEAAGESAAPSRCRHLHTETGGGSDTPCGEAAPGTQRPPTP